MINGKTADQKPPLHQEECEETYEENTQTLRVQKSRSPCSGSLCTGAALSCYDVAATQVKYLKETKGSLLQETWGQGNLSGSMSTECGKELSTAPVGSLEL